MEKKLKYFIYCRKSSEARDRQALSIEAQIRELTEYAQKDGLEIVEIFEESQSAYKKGRPIFQKMMGLLEEGLANAILTWKPDKLARNALDGGRVIQALDDLIIEEIRTPYERFRQEDNRMMLYVLFGMSNDFSRQISANVKRGNRQKYARGEFLGRAPVGYRNAKVGISRNIVIDPVKAPLVKRVFEEYATGKYSVMQILKTAHDWGLTSVTGRSFLKSEMYRLLRLPVYYGIFKHGGEYHNGSYEPIITKQLFDKVQEVLSQRGKPKKQDWIHTYIGLIRCPECSCSITATTKVKNYKRTNRTVSYTYYHCTKRRGPCSQPPVTEEELEQMLFDKISEIGIDKEVWELGVKLLKSRNADEIESHLQLKSQLHQNLAKVERSLSNLLTMRLNEAISAEEYAEQKIVFINQKLELEEKIADRDHSNTSWLELAENFFETAYQAREIMKSDDFEAKRNLVQTVGQNLFLESKILNFEFKKPYDVLLQPEMRVNVQG